MGQSAMVSVVVLLMAGSLVGLVYLLVGGRRSRIDQRLDELSGKSAPVEDAVADFARATLPKMGAALVPDDAERRTKLQVRLVQAGLYGRQAMPFFLGVKLMLMVTPGVIGLVAGLMGIVQLPVGLAAGAFVGVIGSIGPSFWLDRRKARRQVLFRRALPDALDVLVICLEGGLSLPGAMRRVAGELRTAHPALARELNIVQREVQLGRSSGEALRMFADRADMEELRGLSSVIVQTERFGASLVKALRVHAESLRIRRLQHAEELAQKASTKVLFPTVLFILPATFIVILGPAAIQLMAMFAKVIK
jgi:tight adherence protein C